MESGRTQTQIRERKTVGDLAREESHQIDEGIKVNYKLMETFRDFALSDQRGHMKRIMDLEIVHSGLSDGETTYDIYRFDKSVLTVRYNGQKTFCGAVTATSANGMDPRQVERDFIIFVENTLENLR